MTGLEEALAAVPVIAVVRAAASRHLAAVLATLAGSGVRAAEVTMTTPGALEAIRWAARGGTEGVAVGAGTVLTAEAAREAVDAGAGYLITPAVLPEVIEEGRRLGVPVVPGAFTPTEILQAWRGGAALVKVFPASAAGGPGYVRDVLAPLPEVPLVPTGGVRIEDVPAYLRAGARAVGMGAPLLGDACADGDLAALASRARRLLGVIAEHLQERG
ncbi:bifunctional 4-hydroxy-2-oxoglutarate aldolase/2-dehydro-3-deoxy-phosphogluconate aldolase [Nonomuraea sp. NPDC049725]|uniref:bifunctional 4-hydroxy-2-oxoglutarate aldolase/2-dehydro-3-deoxy-phosphogluconate aldolase n=1 Tax=Nonomuraea sp. NPDC049725 TaxID=3154508 RepID=UPI0034388993